MKPSMQTSPGLVVLLVLCTVASSSETSISGVQQVIQMLTNMKVQGQEALKAEQVAYAKFDQWCLDESAKLEKEIGKNRAEIETLTEETAKLESQAAELKDDITQLRADAEKAQAEMKKATAQRKEDRAAFEAEEADYSESVDALARAIDVLKAQEYDRTGKGAAALLQISTLDRIPVRVKSIVSAFLGMIAASKGSADGKQEPAGLDYQAPEANAYEFQSGSIVEMLKKLEDEFRAKLGECQKEEMNSQHAHDMVMMDLKDTVENAEADIKDKTQEMNRKLAKAAENKKQIAATQVILEANQQTLKDMVQECFEKSLSYQEKQKLRKEELDAIQKAIEILDSPEVAGASEKHLELAQTKRATSLVQASRRDSEQSRGVRGRVTEFLAEAGKRLKSKQLGVLAQKIAADPFAKVKALIDEMITRLLAEAKADADHEGFCDTEMGKSKVTRTRLQEEIDGLSAAVEDGKATILELTKSNEELSKAVASLISAMKEATELREAEHKENMLTIEDAKEAQRAVAAATAVLKDFYKKALTATAFVQLKKEANPEWGLTLGVKMGSDEWKSLANPSYGGSMDTGHKAGMQTFGEVEYGQQQEAEYGVLALLEVIQSDFATLEASTKANEANSKRTYDEFMTQSRKDQAKKERKLDMNSADKASAEVQLEQDIADLKATQDELIAAEAYYERLVPQCIDKGMTFDERQAARESEIASLKEALAILDSDDISTSPNYGPEEGYR